MAQIFSKDESELYLPVLSVITPLYATVSARDLASCHRAVGAGEDLSGVLEGKDEAWIRMAYEVSKETESIADTFWSLTPRQQAAYPLDGLSDFTLATLYDIIMNCDAKAELKQLNKQQDEMLMAILRSPTASPLLDYGWMFLDAVQYQIVDRLGLDPVEMLKRSLAHDIEHNSGKQVIDIFHHMATVCIECDELEMAINIHTAILKSDPRRFLSFYELAADLGKAKKFEAAIKVGSRGMGILGHAADESDVASDLGEHMQNWTRKVQAGETGALSSELRGQIESAMYASSLGAPTLNQVIHALVPEIDEIPVKRPWPDGARGVDDAPMQSQF